jgi:hypothetical protein
MRRLAPLVLAAALTNGCYGSWSAARAVHRWNGQVTQSRVANSVIHFGLFVVPVYPIVGFADFLVFNAVEFFTGQPVFAG